MDFARLRSRRRNENSAAAKSRVAEWLALVLAGLSLWSGIVRAQGSDGLRHWAIALNGEYGAPSGYVQVRENRIRGTQLNFGSNLGVNDIWMAGLDLAYQFDAGNSVYLSLQNYTLTGSARLPREANFNGVTFASSTALKTVTNFPNFLRTTLFYQRRFLSFADGGGLSGRVGFTYEFLNFKMQGTPAPDSPGSETKEDFVTQELPIPLLGVALDYPLNDRLHIISSLNGAYLPRVNSLRKEGGEVTLTQTNIDFRLGLSYKLTKALHISGGYDFGYFRQNEQSHEDGNKILLRTNALELGIAYRF